MKVKMRVQGGGLAFLMEGAEDFPEGGVVHHPHLVMMLYTY